MTPNQVRLPRRPGSPQRRRTASAPPICISASCSFWRAGSTPAPTHAKLARAAHCHRNSVLNALHRLRDLGLLTWERQFTRCARLAAPGRQSLPVMSNLSFAASTRRRTVCAGKEGRKNGIFSWPTTFVQQGKADGAGGAATGGCGPARSGLLARRRAWEAGMVRA